MILEDATHEAYGYYPKDLTSQSAKPILATCDNCDKVRKIRYNAYRALCCSCSHKGLQAGDKNPMFGRDRSGNKNPNWQGGLIERTCETCGKTFHVNKCELDHGFGKYCCVSCARKAQEHPSGEDSSSWTGGSKAYNRRHTAKRRGLGHFLLNTSFECSEGHHVTHNYVIFIPAYMHQSIRHNMHTGKNMLKVNESALRFLLEGF